MINRTKEEAALSRLISFMFNDVMRHARLFHVCVVNVIGADKFAMRKEREQIRIITRFCASAGRDKKCFNLHEVTFNMDTGGGGGRGGKKINK